MRDGERTRGGKQGSGHQARGYGRPHRGRGGEGPRGPRQPETAPPGAVREFGTVESVHAEKGFGFLKGEDQARTVRFFHRSAYRGNLGHLHPGTRVSFVATTGTKGPRAIMVEKADGHAEGVDDVDEA